MSEKVRITYDETIPPEKLVHAVEQAGHAVTSWRAARQAEQVEVASPPRRVQTFALLRLLFVGFVSLIALIEIAGGSLGLFCGVEELVPGHSRSPWSSTEATRSSEARSWGYGNAGSIRMP